jgi:hypothetical protein
MKSVLRPSILAVLLLLAGAVSWALGQAQDRAARLAVEIMTMDYKDVADGDKPPDRSIAYASRVPIAGDEVTGAVRNDQAIANYWLGRYEALTLQRDSGGALVEHDPQLLLVAANAAFRANEVDPADRQTAIQRLQTIGTYYADLLKSNPELFDAAYNYEVTARLRTALERSARAAAVPDDKNRPAIHGQPGAPAKGAAPNKLNIIVPKSGDERTNSPEAGQGQQKVRKG